MIINNIYFINIIVVWNLYFEMVFLLDKSKKILKGIMGWLL